MEAGVEQKAQCQRTDGDHIMDVAFVIEVVLASLNDSVRN